MKTKRVRILWIDYMAEIDDARIEAVDSLRQQHAAAPIPRANAHLRTSHGTTTTTTRWWRSAQQKVVDNSWGWFTSSLVLSASSDTLCASPPIVRASPSSH